MRCVSGAIRPAPFEGEPTMIRRAFLAAGAALALAACHPQPKATNTAQANAESKPDPRGQAYLDANAKKPGVHVLPSGLQYEVVSSGPATGQHPHAGDEVKVNYEGKLVDGTVFDSSYE